MDKDLIKNINKDLENKTTQEIIEYFCMFAEPMLTVILQNEHEIVALNNASERILETLSCR